MTATAFEKCDSYIPISLVTIHPSCVPGFALFIRDNHDLTAQLYRDADDPLEVEDVRRLVERGVETLYIAASDQDRYQLYLRENFVAVLNDENLSVKRRFGCLNEVVRHVLAEVFASGNTGKTVTTAWQLSAQTVEVICREDVVVAELVKMLHHDYHTFTHSANVSYFCVLLARAWGIDDRSDLRQIATGALLHDIGKLDIPESILKKRGRLNKHEWETIKQHPTTGLRLLSHRDDLSYGQLMMVYQHHERLDGTGYPVGVSENRIHPWAQLCAIVDMYEALTSHRPYRPGLSQEKTLAMLECEGGTRMNQGMWQCWKTLIQNS